MTLYVSAVTFTYYHLRCQEQVGLANHTRPFLSAGAYTASDNAPALKIEVWLRETNVNFDYMIRNGGPYFTDRTGPAILKYGPTDRTRWGIFHGKERNIRIIVPGMARQHMI